MSWRKFLEAQTDNSRSKISEQSHSQIQDDNSLEKDDKSCFDISEALKKTDILRRLQQNDKSHERSSRFLSVSDDVTYNISNTGATQEIQEKSQILSLKPTTKQSKIQQEMAILKNELSRFPKKKQVQQLCSVMPQKHEDDNDNTHTNHPLRKRNSETNISHYDELSFSNNKQNDHDSFITDDDIQQISNSLQEHLQKSQKDQVYSLNQQGSDISNSASNQVRKILNFAAGTGSDSSKPSRFFRDVRQLKNIKYDIILKKKEYVEKQLESIEQDLDSERKLRQQIQQQLTNSNKEIFHLNTQIQDLQSQLTEFRQSVLSQQQQQQHAETNKRSSVDRQERKIQKENIFDRSNVDQFQQQYSSSSPLKIQKSSSASSNSQNQKKSNQKTNKIFEEQVNNLSDSEYSKTPQHQQEEQPKRSSISVLRASRNQLLEALENIIKVIGNCNSKKSEQDVIKNLKRNLNNVKEIRSKFKTKANQLRMEFLDIGHIEPYTFSLITDSFKTEYSSDYSSQQNQIEGGNRVQQNYIQKQGEEQILQKQQNMKYEEISSQPNIFKSIVTTNFTETLQKPSFNYSLTPPLNRLSQSGKESTNENLNYTPTDVNSFYDNLNETLNVSKGTVLNTNKINNMLQSSLVEKPNHLSQAERKVESKENSTNIFNNKNDNWDKPLQMKQQKSNYDSIYSQFQEPRISYPKFTFRRPSTTKNSPVQEKAICSPATSPTLHQQKSLQHLKEQISPSRIQEELSFRQNVPVPLDLSQKTKDLKQKLMKQKQTQGISNPIQYQNDNVSSSNYMITHQINSSLPSKSSHSLIEQYKQQQQIKSHSLFSHENDSFPNSSRNSKEGCFNRFNQNIMSTEISEGHAFEIKTKQKGRVSLTSNSNDPLLIRYQTFSQQNSPVRKGKEY